MGSLWGWGGCFCCGGVYQVFASLVSWGAGVAYLGEVLHGLFFVRYDMGVRRFVYY